ncbi:MAG: penicillin acylase family protein [Alphaproteobacteria bacterium]|nr:penicillin acylase family protein [Alphaproteobacteria bacterium]
MPPTVRVFLTLTLATALASCAVLTPLPEPRSLDQRLAMIPATALPVQGPVTVWWNEHQVPFIEATTDRDAAFALGLVHAHLRLGQMEVMRRVSQARISEMAGPIPQVADIEHALRILDLGKTSATVYASMPADTKAWLDAFVEGVNHYQANAKELPHEYALLGLEKEPWRAEEILTIGRLASIDVSWLVWIRLMPLREREDWPKLWAQILEEGTASAPSFAWNQRTAANELSRLLSTMSRNGSNSMAVAASKTGTGAAMIASDPHLGISLPNLWVLAGVKSPSYNMVGFMVPGVPFVAVGRNEHIAWGGTNMRSAGSDLFDVSKLPRDQIKERIVPVKKRWWFDSEITVRDTPVGPILSDAAAVPKREGEEFALRWIGHNPSDEFTAMLKVNRARNWDEFRTALEAFSISPQNFVYADVKGNVGQVTATHLPKRSKDLPADLIRPLGDAAAWDQIVTSRDLPQVLNPQSGFVASANNRGADAAVPIGYFFSADDRVTRMQELLGSMTRVTATDLKRIQMDTYSSSSVLMRDAFVARVKKNPAALTPTQSAVVAAIEPWNGRYDRDSKGAVAFEAAMKGFVPAAFPEHEIMAFDATGSPYPRLAAQLATLDPAKFDAALTAGLTAADEAMKAYSTWGDMHRMVVQGQFAAIPVIGSRYVFDDVPAAGSSETLLKTDHDSSAERHATRYGAQARHVSDLSNPDANWFVMLGGNDGWFNSSTFRDQVDAFQNGKSFQVPLQIETVRKTFKHKTLLAPK